MADIYEMCEQYPEVLQSRIDFELAMEKQALENAINPAAELKDRIFERLILTSGSCASSSSSIVFNC